MTDEISTLTAELKAVRKLLSELSDREKSLRQALIVAACPDAPVEGSVKHGDLTFKFTMRRTIDEKEYGVYQAGLCQKGIDLDALVRLKHELNLREYRKLTPEQRKYFDRVLVSKPGLPTIEIAE